MQCVVRQAVSHCQGALLPSCPCVCTATSTSWPQCRTVCPCPTRPAATPETGPDPARPPQQRWPQPGKKAMQFQASRCRPELPTTSRVPPGWQAFQLCRPRQRAAWWRGAGIARLACLGLPAVLRQAQAPVERALDTRVLADDASPRTSARGSSATSKASHGVVHSSLADDASPRTSERGSSATSKASHTLAGARKARGPPWLRPGRMPWTKRETPQ